MNLREISFVSMKNAVKMIQIVKTKRQLIYFA